MEIKSSVSGDVQVEPKKVPVLLISESLGNGGLVTQIYIITSAKEWKEDVFDNYERAEQLEKQLVEQGLPVVPALEFNGSKMQCIDNQYFYVFNWVEAKAIPWNEINREHCSIAGELLAKIHRIKLEEKENAPKLLDIDWDRYIETAKSKCPEIAGKLLDNRDLLYSAQREYNQALESAPGIEAGSDEERRMGTGEVYESIRRIRYYAKIKDELLKYL